MQLLIETHPVLAEIEYDDLYNNFVEILEQFAAERDVAAYYYSKLFN